MIITEQQRLTKFEYAFIAEFDLNKSQLKAWKSIVETYKPAFNVINKDLMPIYRSTYNYSKQKSILAESNLSKDQKKLFEKMGMHTIFDWFLVWLGGSGNAEKIAQGIQWAVNTFCPAMDNGVVPRPIVAFLQSLGSTAVKNAGLMTTMWGLIKQLMPDILGGSPSNTTLGGIFLILFIWTALRNMPEEGMTALQDMAKGTGANPGEALDPDKIKTPKQQTVIGRLLKLFGVDFDEPASNVGGNSGGNSAPANKTATPGAPALAAPGPAKITSSKQYILKKSEKYLQEHYNLTFGELKERLLREMPEKRALKEYRRMSKMIISKVINEMKDAEEQNQTKHQQKNPFEIKDRDGKVVKRCSTLKGAQRICTKMNDEYGGTKYTVKGVAT